MTEFALHIDPGRAAQWDIVDTELWNLLRSTEIWTNPYLPPLPGPQVSVWGPWWEPVGYFDPAGYWTPHQPPTLRAEFTAEDWAVWWQRQFELQAARKLPQFPRPLFPRFRPSVLGYSLLQLAYLLHREYREQLAGQARGRIRFREGKF